MGLHGVGMGAEERGGGVGVQVSSERKAADHQRRQPLCWQPRLVHQSRVFTAGCLNDVIPAAAAKKTRNHCTAGPECAFVPA